MTAAFDRDDDRPDAVGPMGWGHEQVADTEDYERRNFGELRDDMPARFSARPAKPKDSAAWQKILAAMKADGLENGSVSLRYMSMPHFGEVLQWGAQLIGSCVASGAMRAVAYRTMAELFVLGQQEKLLGSKPIGQQSVAPFAPYHYGCGRRRGNLRGGDGSFCSAQIEAFLKDGILMCSHKDLPQLVGNREQDYPETQNERLYRQFGDWKYLDDFIGDARYIKLLESEPIKDVDRLKAAICDELKPAMICSNWGFAAKRKHADGFWIYERSGQWAHNMTLSGIRIDSRGDVFVEVTNSWGGQAHKDGEHFYVDSATAQRWLNQAECQTIGDIDLPDQDAPEVW